MDEQMELARQFQEANKGKNVESQKEEAAPVELEKDRQEISFSFGGKTFFFPIMKN